MLLTITWYCNDSGGELSVANVHCTFAEFSEILVTIKSPLLPGIGAVLSKNVLVYAFSWSMIVLKLSSVHDIQ